MDKWQEFLFLGSNDLVNHISIIIIIHICEVLISCNEWLLTQLSFQVNSKSFDSVRHRVGCLHARKILQKFWGNTHFRWLLSIWVIFFGRIISISVIVSHSFIITKPTSHLIAASVSVASYLKLGVWTRASFLIAYTRLNNTGIVSIVGRAHSSLVRYLSLDILVVVLLSICIIRCAFRLFSILSRFEIVYMLHSRWIVCLLRLVVFAGARLATKTKSWLCHKIVFLILCICFDIIIAIWQSLQLLLWLWDGQSWRNTWLSMLISSGGRPRLKSYLLTLWLYI